MLWLNCVFSSGSQQLGTVPDISDLLKNHAQRYVTIGMLPGDRQHVNVRRRHVWSDMKRAMKRISFNPTIGLEISFVGEDAQDAGGPLREFFRLLWRDIAADNTLFIGPENKRLLTHNCMALQSEHYALVGRCIGLSLLNGGGGPHFLSESVAAYIIGEPLKVLPVEEVPDFEIREKIIKVWIDIQNTM